jgi:hypothetical protein
MNLLSGIKQHPMNKTNYSCYKLIIAGIICLLCVTTGFAQDTTRKRSVNITSTFKPVLRESAKINFTASPPTADETKPQLTYDIPNQNLLFAYQPGSLKPLALSIDSGGRWDNTSYIKAGLGSIKTPFLQTGFSFGDGKSNGLNIYAKHVSSDGKRAYQQFSNTNVSLNGFIQTAKNLEWDASLGMKQDQTYKYGYLPDSLVFPKDSLKQRFQTFSGRISLHNLNRTTYGISYAPEVKIDVFGDNLKNNESNTYVNLPMSKTVGKTFQVDLGLTFDLTRLSLHNQDAINNTMYYISPAFLFKTPNVNLQAGIRPSWDNQDFKLFPNVTAEIGTGDQRFTFQAGWIGYLRKTSYQYLASLNPWLWVPESLKNSRIEERYAGFKGSIMDHFTYSAKIGFNKINNQPLFVNDTASGKSFRYVNESEMKVLNLTSQIGYTVQEKFSLIASFNLNEYTNLKDNAKAWGLIPLELKAAMRLQVFKDLWVTSDVFMWQGPRYQKKDGGKGRLSGAVDMNAGLEFRVTKNLNLWTQFNNIFNKEYQLWNQYPVYGFNFVGGVIFSFAQKN